VFYSDRTLDRTLHRTRFSFTTTSGLSVHQRVRSFPKVSFKIYDRTLHQTRLCQPSRPVPATTTASGHPFQFFGQNMTRLCQHPIMHNRTRLVILGAYWNVTGCCLHRVWSFDHRVRSSRKKRISPFEPFDWISRFSFHPPPPVLDEIPSDAVSPSRRDRAFLAEPPHHRRRTLPSTPVPCLHAREPAARSPAPPRLRSRPVPPSIAPPEPPEPPEQLCAQATTVSCPLPAARAQSLQDPRPLTEQPNPSHPNPFTEAFCECLSLRSSPSP
jgi:hypothetical protein